MDVHAAKIGERAVRRIMALLLSLAVLAERASARSWPVRCFLLWVLRRAETVAADFVFDVTGVPLQAPEWIAAVGDDPADALYLAARFRVLAALLGALLGPDGLLPDQQVRLDAARRRFAPRFEQVALVPGGWVPQPYDTS